MLARLNRVGALSLRHAERTVTTEAEVAAQGVTVVDRLVYTGRRPWSEEWAVLEERILPPVHGMRITVARMERHAEGTGQ